MYFSLAFQSVHHLLKRLGDESICKSLSSAQCILFFESFQDLHSPQMFDRKNAKMHIATQYQKPYIYWEIYLPKQRPYDNSIFICSIFFEPLNEEIKYRKYTVMQNTVARRLMDKLQQNFKKALFLREYLLAKT